MKLQLVQFPKVFNLVDNNPQLLLVEAIGTGSHILSKNMEVVVVAQLVGDVVQLVGLQFKISWVEEPDEIELIPQPFQFFPEFVPLFGMRVCRHHPVYVEAGDVCLENFPVDMLF